MSSRRILVIVDDFGEDGRTVVPFQPLQAADHEVLAVSPGQDPADSSKTGHSVRERLTDLENRGDDFTLTLGFAKVTTDGNLVTAQAWPGHPEYFVQFLDLRGTEIERGATVTTTAT